MTKPLQSGPKFLLLFPRVESKSSIDIENQSKQFRIVDRMAMKVHVTIYLIGLRLVEQVLLRRRHVRSTRFTRSCRCSSCSCRSWCWARRRRRWCWEAATDGCLGRAGMFGLAFWTVWLVWRVFALVVGDFLRQARHQKPSVRSGHEWTPRHDRTRSIKDFSIKINFR